MRDDYDEDDIALPQSRYPKAVYAAGVIWIVIGALILLNAAVNLVVGLTQMGAVPAVKGPGIPQGPGPAQGPPGGAVATTGVCPAVMGLLFGVAFVHAGLQSTKGTARDTLGNAIGSIIIALLNGGFGVIVLLAGLAGMAVAHAAGFILIVIGLISILAGVGLFVAGILALIGRQEYKAWRQMERARTKRE